jgi:hypothetical protein
MTKAKSGWRRGFRVKNLLAITPYRVGLERPEFTPVEHALVDDRIPMGYLKSHHALKQEALPSIR